MPPDDHHPDHDRDDTPDALDTAERLFRSIEAGDLDGFRDCFSPDAVLWSNAIPPRTVDETVEVIRWLVDRLDGATYDVSRREAIRGGFLQEHVLRGTAPDGSAVAMPACIVAAVSGGRITQLREYLDPSQVAALSRRGWDSGTTGRSRRT